MKVFHIDEFKCTLCSNWFCPPFNLPYRLKCTHSICTGCLQKSVENKTNQIICPEDLERNKISQINVNHSTKKALQRLLKEHKNFTQTNHLQCIKSLSLNFDELLDSKEIQLKNLSTLVDQIFENQIKRLRQIYEKIKIEINRPFRIVNDWKEVVRNYLKTVKGQGPNVKGCINEMNHYIDQGRKIKLDLNQYLKYDFKQLIDSLIVQPQVCFTQNFSIFNTVEKQIMNQKMMTLNKHSTLNRKQFTNQKQLCLQDVTNNFDQSSIRVDKKHFNQGNSNKMSLFDELIQETSKHCKSHVSNVNEDSKKTPLKQLIFSSSSNNQNMNGQRLSENDIKNIKKGQNQKNGQQSGYNSLIKEKIRNLKTQQVCQQPSSIKKVNKLGRSLQYSPQNQQFANDQLLQQYSIHQSVDDQPQEQEQLEEYTQTRCQRHRSSWNKIGFNKSMKLKQNPSQKNSHMNDSLHSYYQQSTTLPKRSIRALPSGQNMPSHHSSDHKSSQQSPSQSQQQQLLLDEKSSRKPLTTNPSTVYPQKSKWQLQNLNFLQEWKVNSTPKSEQQMEIIQKYGGYNCQKEKNKYVRKIEENKVREILQEIVFGDNYIELVGLSLQDCNLPLLLSQVDWCYRNIQIVKFIKTSLSDTQLNQLLNYLVHSNVHTLMLSYNNLTQQSLDALLNFFELNKKLRNIYLPKNNISLLKGMARTKMNLLKQKGINLYM